MGWKEWEKVERLQERYIRWVLEVDGRTPGYIVKEERKRKKMRTRLGRRAMGYEEKIEKGGGSECVKICWEEIRKRGEKELSRWETKRRDFYRERGVLLERVMGSGEVGRELKEEIDRRDVEIQQQEKFARIQRSK